MLTPSVITPNRRPGMISGSPHNLTNGAQTLAIEHPLKAGDRDRTDDFQLGKVNVTPDSEPKRASKKVDNFLFFLTKWRPQLTICNHSTNLGILDCGFHTLLRVGNRCFFIPRMCIPNIHNLPPVGELAPLPRDRDSDQWFRILCGSRRRRRDHLDRSERSPLV